MSEEEVVQALTMFDAGVPVDKIRARYGLTRKQLGLLISDGRKPEINVKDIVAKYSAGWSLDRLGVQYCVDSSVIRGALAESNAEIRQWGEHSRVHQYNQDFFGRIDTEHKAYWLGFMYGDGNVCQRLQQVTVGLNRVDRAHLEKFCGALGANSELVVDWDREAPGGTQQYSKVVLSSKKMALDLFSHGCIPNKSLVAAAPVGVPTILERHFIRGVWDADGSLLFGGKQDEMSLVGTHELLAWIGERLPGTNPAVRPHGNIWRIRSLTANVSSWVNYLYGDSAVYLDRKFKVAEGKIINVSLAPSL